MSKTFKKLLASALAATMLFSTAVTALVSSAATTVGTISVGTDTVNVGDATATVDVTIDFGANAITAPHDLFTLTAPEGFTLTGATIAEDAVTYTTLPEGSAGVYIDPDDGDNLAAGKVLLEAPVDSKAPVVTKIVVTVTYAIADTVAAGTYDIAVDSEIADITEQDLVLDEVDGSIVVAEAHVCAPVTKYDETGHWTECECGEKTEVVAHVLGDYVANEDGTTETASCDCGYSVTRDIEVACDHANAEVVYVVEGANYITKKVCDCGYEEVIATVTGVKFSHSLNLQSDISINYVVLKNTVATYGSDLKAVFKRTSSDTGEVVTTTITDYVEYDTTTYWNFQYQGIAACEIADDVTAELYATVDGVDILLFSEQYNILTYIDNQIEKDNNAPLCELLMNLVRYASDAQVYFDYDSDNLVKDKYTAAIAKYVIDPDRTEFTSVKNTVGSTTFNSSLNLAGKVSVNVLYQVATYTGSTDGLSLRLSYYDTVKKETVYVEGLVSDITDLGYGSKYKGLALAIPAAQFSADITGELLLNGESTGCSYTYSVESYAESKYVGDGSALSNLSLTMMAYGDSAAAYF